MSKRFALCLALVMVLGISVPSVANAEEDSNVIDVVEVNDVQEAVVGEVVTDSTNMILWIALAVIAMAGMAVVVSKKRYEA